MTRHQAYIEFIDIYFDGNRKKLRKLVKDDYCRAQFMWSHHTDMLCRSGRITLKQYETWLTPFKKRRN